MASFSVPIVDDEVAESPEDFFLDLEIPPASLGVVKGSPGIATVSITDEDSEYCSNALCPIERKQHAHSESPCMHTFQSVHNYVIIECVM